MIFDREQTIRAMADAAWAIHFPYSTPDQVDLLMQCDEAAASLPIAVRAVTEVLRPFIQQRAIVCRAAPGEYGPERPWLDLQCLIDQIEAACEAQR